MGNGSRPGVKALSSRVNILQSNNGPELRPLPGSPHWPLGLPGAPGPGLLLPVGGWDWGRLGGGGDGGGEGGVYYIPSFFYPLGQGQWPEGYISSPLAHGAAPGPRPTPAGPLWGGAISGADPFRRVNEDQGPWRPGLNTPYTQGPAMAGRGQRVTVT